MINKNIAFVSPRENAYPETFIQAQRDGLKGNIFYYYDGALPKKLEHYGSLYSRWNLISNKLKFSLKITTFNPSEQAFARCPLARWAV